MKKKLLKRFCLKLIKSTCRFPKKAGINFTRWVVRLLWCMRALRVSPKILYIYILRRMFINRKLLALKDTSLFTDVSNQATVTRVSTKSISRLNWFSQWLVLAICDSGNKPHWRTASPGTWHRLVLASQQTIIILHFDSLIWKRQYCLTFSL